MDKFSGFILSAILVVLCLWLSVSSFPNVIQPGVLPESLSTTARASSEADVDAFSSEPDVPETEPARESPVVQDQESAETASQESSDSPSPEDGDFSGSSRKYADASLAVDLPTLPKSAGNDAEDAIKESGRAQGGKYVSIPSVEMDAFHRPEGSPYSDRVISATRAVVPQTVPASYNRE